MDYLKGLDKEQLSGLRKVLGDHTLVCEYVGHEDHQHLVKYAKPALLFYAMVTNDIQDESSCVPPPEAYRFFEEYGLETVPLKLLGEYAHPVEFLEAVDRVFDYVCAGKLDSEEEGSVLYFVGGGRTLALAKLKTLEYRFWRKLREKIKHVTP
jgi:hypothetical protein